MKPIDRCPCGAAADYSVCCGRYLDTELLPDTAEALMRSRYVAYFRARTGYLLFTWHPSTRPSTLDLEGEPVRWIGLQVRRVEAGGPDDRHGIVEFVARYKVGGRAYRLHETSRFVREDGRWFYMNALV
ncbi:YchJ family metal-binding protein [Thiocapsa sp.]|uniref:YchJ family protein n=1 Tax=Thiocapsa sp. TaxID=2024551 RepID=UPI0025F8546D|nr:YchJ family metal-binding protein [Thiocapsa sp.]